MKKNKKDSVRYSNGLVHRLPKEVIAELCSISDTSEAKQAMEEISESLGENIENCFNDIINIANLSI